MTLGLKKIGDCLRSVVAGLCSTWNNLVAPDDFADFEDHLLGIWDGDWL
jgi:hypothetical protein